MGSGYSKMEVTEFSHIGIERVLEQRLIFSMLLVAKMAVGFPGLNRVSNNEERVAIICKGLINHNLLLYNNTCTKTVKTAEASRAHRGDGNAAYLSKPQDLELALLCYNKAVATAPFPTSEEADATELALAFGNRSAVMLARKQYKECLWDIGEALRYHHPDNDKVIAKLLQRGRECLHVVGTLEDAKRGFKKTGKALFVKSQDVENDLIQVRKLLSKIAIGEGLPEVINQLERARRPPPRLADGPNPRVPALASCVELAYDPKYGRLIRATRDIQPGEVLLFEKPYVMNPTPDLQHCDNCGKKTDALIPCKTCHVVMFCSSTCRDESWQRSHELECPVLLMLVDYADTETARALRTLMTALTRYSGIRGLFDYVQKLESDTEADGRIRGFNDEGKYLSSDYSTVHFLMDHAERRSRASLLECALMSAVVLIHIERHGNASLNRELKDVQMKKFVGGLLVKYLLSGKMNANALSAYDNKDVATLVIGGATYPVSSMMNHACQSNTYEINYGIVNFATSCRRIARGDVVTVTYTEVLNVLDNVTRDRKLILQEHYFFSCTCLLCTQVWPLDCGEQSFYLTCLQCRATLPVPCLAFSDTKCLHCNVTNRGADLLAAEVNTGSSLDSLLSRAVNGEDVSSEVHRRISEYDAKAIPQKGRSNQLKRTLHVVSIMAFGCDKTESPDRDNV